MSPEEIVARARQVDKIALEYYLTPMIFACRELIKDEFNQHIEKETARLKAELEKTKNGKRIKAINKRVEQLCRPFAIRIEYFADKNKGKDLSRVAYNDKNNDFVIHISRHMVNAALNEDGSANLRGAVKQFQWEMACHIGCITLFFQDLMKTPNVRGNRNALNEQQKAKTEAFATELIHLLGMRNRHLGTNDR